MVGLKDRFFGLYKLLYNLISVGLVDGEEERWTFVWSEAAE